MNIKHTIPPVMIREISLGGKLFSQGSEGIGFAVGCVTILLGLGLGLGLARVTCIGTALRHAASIILHEKI